MKPRRLPISRGFTLVELMVSMSLGTVVMLAVFSTYNYIGRNLTRLSYKNILETQGRRILTTLTSDLKKTQSVANATATTLTLNQLDGTSVVYDVTGNKLRRDPDGSGPLAPVYLNYDIGDANTQVPVSMPSFSFLYYTSTGGNPTSQFNNSTVPIGTDPATITPLSVKQIAVRFTVQAGSSVQAQLGTLTQYEISSARLPLINRQLPDGT